MARYCGAVCRLCRREGEKLFLKGERCFSSKCSVEKREGGPGQHGKSRKTFSGFKIQLRAKQKAKRIYGVLEKQFRANFEKATKTKGVTGTQMLVQLERRLDNVVYRLGFGASRPESRQLVNHGHIIVNGKRVDIPSCQLAIGDIIEVKDKSKKNSSISSAVAGAVNRIIPAWLILDKDSLKGTVQAFPTREELPQNIKEQLIVELYSK